MKLRHKRLALVGGVLALLAVIGALVVNAMRSNLVFFYTPTQVAAKEAPEGKSFRIGGLVVSGSLQREGVLSHFVVTDGAQQITVRYRGALPDLFKEGRAWSPGQAGGRDLCGPRGAGQARRELHAARGRCRHEGWSQTVIAELGHLAFGLRLAWPCCWACCPGVGPEAGERLAAPLTGWLALFIGAGYVA